MNFLKNRFSKAVLGAFAISAMLQGCGSSSSSGECCQGEPKLADKIKEVDKVATVPEVKGNQIVYVDRNVTVIQYVDRNVTVIKYIDRNVTVDVIKVRPDARITGLIDGTILKDATILTIDSVESSDEDGNVTKYQWRLDDVNISTEKSPTIDLPPEPGTHTLCLLVTDNDDLISTETCKSFIIPEPNSNPTAAITGLNDNVVKTKCPVAVSGTTSIANNSDITSYIWTIDNNQTLNGKDQNLSFDTLGEHEVCLEVIDSNDLNNTQCSIVDVQDHEAPTPMLTMFDGATVITSADLLTRGGRYDFSCAGSVDDCGNEEPMTCEWNAHSYIIGVDGVTKIDYISDCFGDPNEGPSHGAKIAKDSYLILCGSDVSHYKYVEIELKITDQFGKTTTETKIFEVAQ